MFSTEEVIDIAIQLEQNGEKVYQSAVMKKQDRAVGSLLKRLADDEAKHAQWLREMKKTVGRKRVDQQLEEMGKKLLKNIVGDQAFSLSEADLSEIGDTDRLIDLALEFEKDTVIFYEMIGSFISEQETLDHLKKIIEEENEHINILRTLTHKNAE